MYSPVQARYFNELLISTFTIAGATPRYVQYVTQVHTMLVLVRSGIGIALVPASAATLHPDGVVFRSIGGVPGAPGGARCGMAGRQFESRSAAAAERCSAATGVDDRRSGRGRASVSAMLWRTKLVVASAGLALSLSTGAGIASAQPDVSAIVNSTCTYPQVMAALNDQNPGVAAELNANQLAVGWLQSLVAAPPAQRAQMVQQVQALPALQPYMPVIFQVASTCNNY